MAEASADQWSEADKFQSILARLVELLRAATYPIFPAYEALLNAQGVAGKCYTFPIRPLSEKEKEKLPTEPPMREALAF